VAFSPDGNTLASASRDTTALLWDVREVRHAVQLPAHHLAPEAMQALWTDLASTDASRAYRAIAAMRAAPEQSMPFVKEHVRPVSVDLARIKQLIADLDNDRFAVRQKATEELEKLGEAEPMLRQALVDRPSVEARRRIGQLLAKFEAAVVPDGEVLRSLRAVVLLERLGTPEARRVLQEWAKGAPGARLTKSAKEALDYLAKRPAPGP
jgi:hypothetical protein